MSYRQLTLKERYHISQCLGIGMSQKEIAESIGVHPSTISRELRRNRSSSGEGYEYDTAELLSRERHRKKPKHRVIDSPKERYIRAGLNKQWSPEQIAGRMRLERDESISVETIYRFIYANSLNGGRLYKNLRQGHKHRRHRGEPSDGRGVIPDRVLIDERPEIVEEKSRIGDLELDTVIGKGHQGALVTLVDRKSKFLLMRKVASKHARVVTDAMVEMLEPIKEVIKTLTSDNGKEFAYHKEVAQKLDSEFYFAHPYHSWERGLNEHTNGLVRQYLPKKTDFGTVTDREVLSIQEKLNHRPRKVLNYRTPYEVFFEEFLKEIAA